MSGGEGHLAAGDARSRKGNEDETTHGKPPFLLDFSPVTQLETRLSI